MATYCLHFCLGQIKKYVCFGNGSKNFRQGRHTYFFLIIFIFGEKNYALRKAFILPFKMHKVCLFVCLLYVPSQQLWSLRDGQFT